MWVVGVDGCPGGWLAIRYDIVSGELSAQVHGTFAELLSAHERSAAIGVDIPIGLTMDEPRRCDLDARRLLGPRRSSVFPAPDPRLLEESTYQEALERSRGSTGRGISRQAFAIYPKVAEVNRLMTPALQSRVFEVHPEVSFWALAGERPMANPKRRVEGFAERRRMLQSVFGDDAIPTRQVTRRMARPASPDDVLDAIVAAWTARRHAEGTARRLPADPPVDARGLRMEIVF